MATVAIIGGSGFTHMSALEINRREVVHTPFGEPSAPLIYGEFAGQEIVFLPRHGASHRIPPHMINYRANIWALKELGVEQVIAIAAVGGITPAMAPGTLVLPDQIIDYTYNRAHTFFEHDLTHVTHIDFTTPYCTTLSGDIAAAAKTLDIGLVVGGTYGATQGPRLETAMEITRMERDGCDLVGMTGMPEAALAKELSLSYAGISVVANWAAGKSDLPITMEQIEKYINDGLAEVIPLLSAYLKD